MRETRNTQKKRNTRSIVIVGLLLLLVAVIGFGGYTLSKYVTKKSGSASATVAKWGFTVEADASNIFGEQYKKGVIVEANTEGIDVSASTENKNLVAPGTTGSMTFSVKGSAEVRAQIEIKLTGTDVVLKYTKAGVAQDDYNPVKWTLKKNDVAVENAENVTLEKIATALNKTVTYKPNETAVNDVYTLSWAWAFSTGDENDALDTLLGMYANNTASTTNGDYAVVDGTNTKIAFTLDISITQLQQA